MNRPLFACTLILAAIAACAQQPEAEQAANRAVQLTERNQPVTRSDLYCAGYVTPKPVSRGNFVAGGLYTPAQTVYGTGDYIFLRGSAWAPGTKVSLVRAVKDPNEYAPFPAARVLQAKTGQIYHELGYATVVEKRGTDTAIARVDFACESMEYGDLVVPFAEREAVNVRAHSVIEEFPASAPALKGTVIAARDFDQFLGAGKKIYLSVGSGRGVKPGDYFRIMRNYEPQSMDPTDAAVFNQFMYDDTQLNPPALTKKQYSELPRHVVGEAVVLTALPGSATAMITFTVEEIQVGDSVEKEEAE